ncbi:MAG: single-stranded DNA-binding protein [Ornithinimicrobium sp.]
MSRTRGVATDEGMTIMNESHITVCGNVTNVPQVKNGKDTGVPFTVFGLAQNRSRREANGDVVHMGTSFYEVVAFRVLGQNVFDSITKGDPIVVHGRLRVNDWESGEKKGTQVQIDATSIGPDLTFGTSQFTKRRKAAQQSHDRIEVEVGGVPMTVDEDGEVFERSEDPAGHEDPDSVQTSKALKDSEGSLVAS